MPWSLTTTHGGFYINFGQLDFRDVSDDSVDGFHHKKKIRRVRCLQCTPFDVVFTLHFCSTTCAQCYRAADIAIAAIVNLIYLVTSLLDE